MGGWDIRAGVEAPDVFTYNPHINSWVQGPLLPFCALNMAAVEHAGCIYACGGWPEGDHHPPNAALLMLDPRTRDWEVLPDMPAPAAEAGAAVVAGRLYMPGGTMLEGGSLATMQCYDVVAGRWDTGCAPMLQARQCHGVAAPRGEVWAVGGHAGEGQELTSVEVYSPRLNTWRRGVPLPTACSGGTCTVVQS